MNDAQLRQRFNVTVHGDGPVTLLFVHGLGCNQSMWRFVAPHFEDRFRVVMMDLMGCGRSDWSAWEPGRYATLDGHAQDLIAVAQAFAGPHTVLVVHSVATMIGLLADLKAPPLFAAHAMFAPSPCYLNEGGYTGGFERETLAALLEMLDNDGATFAGRMAPVIMGESHPPGYAREIEDAFCATLPEAFRQFARATFEGDFRARLPQLVKPVLVLQCTEDVVAPRSVGEYMATTLPDARLVLVPTQGHVPQMADPTRCIQALEDFLEGLGLDQGLHEAQGGELKR
ncbi:MULTISPECIES: alpha/beta hydrolase [Ramlibacter]|uniref:Alpha/beta hydrolase n=1 Tax=Ramlibacter aquaticus TaxID=2780094 RepID=A0ABR9SGS6_9BURK|nr:MULTISPECIES: alpha/beta hydrolase [Ramlibacter]MBE7941559.1 alpha/beta hydrolase [Ramlibacter aquaticus]